jgi:signal transduction histidine kinase
MRLMCQESSPEAGSDGPPDKGPGSPVRGIHLYGRRTIIDAVQHSAFPALMRFVMRGVGDVSNALARQSLLVAAVCLAADVTGGLTAGPVSRFGVRDWAVLAAVVMADAALALPARLSGWVAMAHAGIRLVAPLVLSESSVTSQAGLLVAGYRAGAWLRGADSAAAIIALAIGVGGWDLLGGDHGGEILVVALTKDALLPWLVGRYTTSRRAYIADLERQAESERRAARAALEQAIADERSAVARDLHDVISHYVSAIGVHAGAARMGLRKMPGADSVADSLTAVETASRSAMVDLRRLLSLLHGDSGDANRQPGLGNLEELLDGVRLAGLPARLRTVGAARPLPESLEIALYRITQEMLTNALRHGDGSVVDIELRYGGADVSLTSRNGITQAAPGRRAAGRGGPTRGLAGIRKRAALFEGTVSHGPDPAGGVWVTSTTFPLGGHR